MTKKTFKSSPSTGLKKMIVEDIRNRKWAEAEMEAIQRACGALAVKLDSVCKDVPRLTAEQLSCLPDPPSSH
jgi:hypothetical protein